NGSKPYQAQLIQTYGLRVPQTLITNDPPAVLGFPRQQGALIYKTIHGGRSNLPAFRGGDRARLQPIRRCPAPLLGLPACTDVQVHVIDQDASASEIVSDKIDYRYAKRAGGSAELRATELPTDIVEKCIALTRGLGLAFAGIDLKRTPDGEFFCFEVNPSPAF